MIHPYDPQAAMAAKYEAFARKNAATARRLQADPAGRAIEEAQQRIAAKLAARAPRVGEIQRIPADPFRSELVSIAAGLLHVCGEDPGEDEKLRIAAVRLRDLADGAAPRASQAAGEPHSTGCGSRTASDPGGGSAGHTERCESRHPERGLLCTLPTGHDTHRHVGDAWTTLDRLDGHALVRTEDLAAVLAYADDGGDLPFSEMLDRLSAALKEATEADQ